MELHSQVNSTLSFLIGSSRRFSGNHEKVKRVSFDSSIRNEEIDVSSNFVLDLWPLDGQLCLLVKSRDECFFPEQELPYQLSV